MISDLVEMLDRQYEFMRSRGDLDLLRHLPRYVATISRDLRILAALDELAREAISDLHQINSERRAIADEAAGLRDRYLDLFPGQDDRGSEHDARFNQDFRRHYRNSIRHFDRLISSHPLGWPDVRERDHDQDPLQVALQLLSSRLPEERGDDAPVNGLGIKIGNLERCRADLHRRYELHCFASPAVAVVRIRFRASRLTPPADIYESPVDLGAFFEKALAETFSFDGVARRVVYGDEARGDGDTFKKLVPAVVADLDLLHEELRARIALRRSLLTVVHRYRTRAQWYDALALRKIANTTSRHEDALTAHFARYMHDNGLNPLTRPMLGPLQPDLFDPHIKWSFYVEAKQYSDRSPKSKLVRGFHQVWDTLGQQKGSPYEVREAFYIVFRLGGPRVIMPEEVRLEGITVYPILVDIANSKAMGSRQKDQPLTIAEADLLPIAAHPSGLPARRKHSLASPRQRAQKKR